MKLLSLFILLFSLDSFSQSREELIEEYMKERNKMMQEIMKMFQDDMGSMLSDDFFGNDTNSFFNEKSIIGGSQNVKVEQKYEKDGSISVLIIPQNKNVQLDISTSGNMITIKSETKVIEENQEDNNNFKSMSSSKMSKSISIPSGYKALSPTQEGEGIKISLIPDSNIKKVRDKKYNPNDKKPIKMKGQKII